MSNYFQASVAKPFHLSIGAIVVDADGMYLVHHFEKHNKFEDFNRLMIETMEEGESIEETLHRGLLEEFGATGEIQTFIGSKISNDEWFAEIQSPTKVEKTVLFFLVKLKDWDESNRLEGDPESHSKIVKISGAGLLENMKEKSLEYNIEEFDLSEIVDRAGKYLSDVNKKE